MLHNTNEGNMILRHIKDGSLIVFSSKKYVALGIGSFIIFLLLYLFTLPATYTGGRIGLISLRLLNVKLVIFSFIMALLVSLIIPFTIYAFRQGVKAGKAKATSGFLGSVLPPILCCSPLLPSVAAIFGAISPSVLWIGGAVQGFIATYETYILLGATLLLLFAAVQTSKSTKQCIC